MSWLDRVRGSIGFTSPAGEVFLANWVGDERSAEKQLGVFNYPKVDKQVIQDLGLSSVVYPLNIIFDGVDNDLESTRFFQALSARGPWLVDHPTKGRLILQPVSFTEKIAPVDSGSLTFLQTQWIDIALPSSIVSVEQLSALIESQALVVEQAGLDQMIGNVDQSTTSNILAVKSATEKSLAVFDETLKPLAGNTGDDLALIDAIINSIVETIETTPIDLTVLGGQIQALVRAPAASSGELLSDLRAYRDFIHKLISIPVNAADQTQRNLTAIYELFLVSASSSSNLIASRSTPATRSIALTALDEVFLQFKLVTDALDAVQDLYIDQQLNDQYFSQSLGFVESSLMTARALSFLLTISFDLAIEKRFPLKFDRSPIEIAISEYGELGETDINFDFFINTNKLKGNQILMLPAGFEVVVYV